MAVKAPVLQPALLYVDPAHFPELLSLGSLTEHLCSQQSYVLQELAGRFPELVNMGECLEAHLTCGKVYRLP